MHRKLFLLIASIIIIVILVSSASFYYSNYTNIGILKRVTSRDGYSLDIAEKSVEIKLLIKPEWIPFESDKPKELNLKLLERNNTNIIIDQVLNRGNDIYFSFDTTYNLNNKHGEFLYNGVFNPDGTYSLSSNPEDFEIYDLKHEKIDIGQSGFGPNSAFSFGIEPSNHKKIKEGFYVKYSGMILYKYSKK